MPLTKPFSFADSLQAASGAAVNTVNVRAALAQQAGEQAFRDTARQASFGEPGQVPQPGQSVPPGVQPSAVPPPPAGGPGAPPGAGGPPPVPGAPPGVGQSLSSATKSPNAQAIEQLFTVETAGHQKGYNPEYHAQLLEQQGYPDKAALVRQTANQQASAKLGMQTQVMEYVSRAAPLVTDQESLDTLRGSIKAIGLDPNMIPPKFTKETQPALRTLGLNAAKQADIQYKNMELTQNQQKIDISGKAQGETGRHNLSEEAIARQKIASEAQIAQDKAMKEHGASVKPNDVRMRVADLFGGVYDPQSGRIAGLDKDKTTKALALQSAAERIQLDAGGTVTPAEAVSRAARQMGMMVPQVGAQPAQPNEQVYTNPQTKERIVYRDGQWIPLP